MTATEFTPLTALLGGFMIGLSALLMLAFNGRITGISGIVGNLFGSRGSEFGWRLAFVSGLLIGAGSYAHFAPADLFQANFDSSLPLMIMGGLIVGVGTQIGNGCTSGHGVCGIGRLSPRSMVATATFMATAGLTVFVVRHLLGGQ